MLSEETAESSQIRGISVTGMQHQFEKAFLTRFVKTAVS